ncbi:MAG: hypothetical protein C5B50_03835 [Verrucomicrobia bacterium]|nr:MAG: hypothetical protein C5B50_03835 [Verrucomicrobiota bacterium]
MSANQIEQILPNLKAAGYRVTGPATPRYNCFAWAGNDTEHWWQPVDLHGFYWPQEVAKELNLENLMSVYKRRGYRPCSTADLQPGVEKIAIYIGLDGTPTHVARQLSSGNWTSKLGDLEDIEHSTLDALRVTTERFDSFS